MPWDRQRALDAAVPARWTAPTGNSFAIDYAAEAGPRVDVRVQEVFGLNAHPTVANGRAPLVMSLLSLLFEKPGWKLPSSTATGAILFNAVLIFGFAHAAWFYLVRTLPPVASTLSVMLIPILGVFSGAWWLGEVLHWQDWMAVFLMVAAIASVLLPHRSVKV